MADVALSFLLHELVEVLKWYGNLVAGAEEEFRTLQEELSKLKAFLEDEAEQPKKRKVFKEMERQVRELVYEVEDTIADCLTQMAAAKEKNVLVRCLEPGFINLAQKVKQLREDKVKGKMSEVMAMSSRGEDGPSGTVGAPQPEEEKIIRLQKVEGFEDEEDTIIKYLMEQREELDVISIIGMPGLGKTTLAWQIYRCEKIVNEFPTRIWIHGSKNFKSRDVFLKILQQSSGIDKSNLSGPELSWTVHENLKEKKFLLVMDDVWSLNHWEDIKKALPNGNKVGKVLITSDEKKVGRNASAKREPHMLRLRSPEESWKLLQLEVFGNLKSCPQNLEGVGQVIANQCDGVPLIIEVIGRILKDKVLETRSNAGLEQKWTEMSKDMGLILRRDEGNHISDVVGLSYNRLSHDLRDCFLYLGGFPENHEIPASTLTRLWVAEGFIQPKEEKTMEETAEKNLSDLIEKNLLIVEKKYLDQVKTCRVHKMIHAFCRSKALEQNFFQVIKKSKEEVREDYASNVKKFHRLCLHSNLKKFLSVNQNGSQVRSILYFCKEPVALDPKDISAIRDAFSLLRVLDSKPTKLCEIFLNKLTILTHLRYITLSIDGLKFIPKQISQLRYLQTLVIETNSPSITMKANIWQMIRLRHLKTKAAIVLNNKKWKGEAGENLQTMSRLSAESCTGDVLERARNLNRLGINGKFNCPEMLKPVSELANLKRLTLSRTSLDWKHMSTLAKIDTLEVLKLKNYAFNGDSWNADGEVFKSLQFLLIVETDLVVWEASDKPFPILSYLVLKKCKELRKIPAGIAKYLKKLDIDYLGKTAVESARRIEEEKQKAEEQENVKLWGPFKLTIGPGCAQ